MDLLCEVAKQVRESKERPNCIMFFGKKFRWPRKRKKAYKKLFGRAPKADVRDMIGYIKSELKVKMRQKALNYFRTVYDQGEDPQLKGVIFSDSKIEFKSMNP